MLATLDIRPLCKPIVLLLVLVCLASTAPLHAERETVLKQIDVPHNYYFREMYLPQLTSGPSSVSWSPDGRQLVYSMQGSLWLQTIGSTRARQLTAGPGYDYQPDWSPDGTSIAFARYHADVVELQLLNLASGAVSALTHNGAVNLEPRWSPDGRKLAWVSTRDSGRFHIRVADTAAMPLHGQRLQAERRNPDSRIYYSEFDHELSPSWSPDGNELLFISNPDSAYGTGGLWRRGLRQDDTAVAVHNEETTWKARPDWAPDGNRIVWSSYHGRQWHQLWLVHSTGGDPLPLSFGAFDITAARWSPDGRAIAYISNETGGLSLWVQQIPGGSRQRIEAVQRDYLQPMGTLQLQLADENGTAAPARLSVRASDGRSYAPDNSWMHADDAFDRQQARMETHYFHSNGSASLTLPAGPVEITAWLGLEHEAQTVNATITAGDTTTLRIEHRALDVPAGWSERWVSGDVHVHMNYGGSYRNTPQQLVQQARAEDLDVVFNLVVNKEQRIPDIRHFSPDPDPASNAEVLLLHAQEFHTGYWGHLGLLGLDDHLLLPDFSAYPGTALASPYPDNATVADLAHQQNALVGYVHPYDAAPDPQNDQHLSNALPIDVALGKVDYYEVSGFSDYRETQQVWYRLLNCGFRLTAAAGTDAMANYASLRGPVGLNRVYVLTEAGPDDAASRRDRWLQGLEAGRSMATNGPLLGFELAGQPPGGTIKLPAGTHRLDYSGFMQSIVAMDYLEVVVNGQVVHSLDMQHGQRVAEFSGKLELAQSGWVVLRAWNKDASPLVFDRFPYATTNPVFVEIGDQPVRSRADADYFLAWIDRVRQATLASESYNTETERQTVLQSIDQAREVFLNRR